MSLLEKCHFHQNARYFSRIHADFITKSQLTYDMDHEGSEDYGPAPAAVWGGDGGVAGLAGRGGGVLAGAGGALLPGRGGLGGYILQRAPHRPALIHKQHIYGHKKMW